MKKPEQTGGTSSSAEQWLERLIWGTVAAGVVLVPVYVSPTGHDSFRVPKELLFRAELLLIAALLFLRILISRRYPRELRWQPWMVLASLAIFWTAVSSAVSTNRPLSLPTLLWVIGCTFFLFSVEQLARRKSFSNLWLIFSPALLTAIVVLLQAVTGWYPFELTHDFGRPVGLQGNPNDAGAILLGPALAAIAAFLTRPHWDYGVTAGILAVAIFATRTLSAMGAFFAGAMLIALIAFPARKVAVAWIALVAVAAAGMLLVPPLRERLDRLSELARAGKIDQFLSSRLNPFLAAIEMTKDRPFTGVGPGCFVWQYFPYKIQVEGKYPHLLDLDQVPPGYSRYASQINYGEVHNDHLEILAETGVPGYVLFLTSLGVLSWASLRDNLVKTRLSDPRQRFAGILSLPLAVSFAILTLAAFPLQLAGTTILYLFLGGLCLAWKIPEPPS